MSEVDVGADNDKMVSSSKKCGERGGWVRGEGVVVQVRWRVILSSGKSEVSVSDD